MQDPLPPLGEGAKDTLSHVTFDPVLLPLRVAYIEEQTFPGLYLPAEYPLPAASSDPGAGEPVHARLPET